MDGIYIHVDAHSYAFPYIYIYIYIYISAVLCGGYSAICVGALPSELRESRPEQQMTSPGSMKHELMVVKGV